MKSVVVTGASTGIGRGCVSVLIGKGFRVFGSVRKQVDGDALSQAFGERFQPLLFDVTDSSAVSAGADAVAKALGGESLFGLVNNAGIAVAGPLLYLDPDELRHQLEVNVTGPLLVTQAFAPLLRQSASERPGRIVMMSSVAGRNASPFLGPYSASKFALEGLSESLRRELMLLGIDVIIIAPGAVATPIWDKAEQADTARYANTPFVAALNAVRGYMLEHGPKGLKPEVLGEAVWRALTVAWPKTRYVVTPDPVQELLVHTMPKRMVDRMMAKRLGLMPKA